MKIKTKCTWLYVMSIFKSTDKWMDQYLLSQLRSDDVPQPETKQRNKKCKMNIMWSSFFGKDIETSCKFISIQRCSSTRVQSIRDTLFSLRKHETTIKVHCLYFAHTLWLTFTHFTKRSFQMVSTPLTENTLHSLSGRQRNTQLQLLTNCKQMVSQLPKPLYNSYFTKCSKLVFTGNLRSCDL